MQEAWDKLCQAGFTSYSSLSQEQKVWFNIELLVIDGPIDHYINSGGDHNEDTLIALLSLGFKDIADQMQRINRLFNNGVPPIDISERNNQWNDWCDDEEAILDEVEKYFWSRSVDLEIALVKYLELKGTGK